MKYTNEQIANSYILWGQYIDPMGLDSRENWENMSLEERINIINQCFPD